jgi:hypothetical protein
MNPTPSESVLIIRILDALSDSDNTDLGISNFIKAKHYRVETAHEIKTVIRKYLLGDKVILDPIQGLYKLKNRSQIKSFSKVEPKTKKNRSVRNYFESKFKKEERKPNEKPYQEQLKIDIPQNVSFLNELFKRREQLMRLPVEERLNKRKLEIIETIAEIDGIKPLAIEELSFLEKNIRTRIILELIPSLKNEIQKVTFHDDKIQVEDHEIDEISDDEGDIEFDINYFENEKIQIESIDFVNDEIIKNFNAADQLENNDFIIDKENETNDIQNKELIPVESVIKLIIEEKIRLGKLDGNLLAENIMFRIKKGKWD